MSKTSMRCVVCGKGMQDGVSLHRINPKGEEGKWACWEHYNRPPNEADEIARIIHENKASAVTNREAGDSF